tara:strand:- start:255 stop:575 length:321 start_codon:yes stop_codon:yes gene_type:complete
MQLSQFGQAHPRKSSHGYHRTERHYNKQKINLCASTSGHVQLKYGSTIQDLVMLVRKPTLVELGGTEYDSRAEIPPATAIHYMNQTYKERLHEKEEGKTFSREVLT